MKVGDWIRVPSGELAQIVKVRAGYVQVQYSDNQKQWFRRSQVTLEKGK